MGEKETYREWLVMNYGYYFNRTLVSADIFLEFKYHLRSSLRRLFQEIAADEYLNGNTELPVTTVSWPLTSHLLLFFWGFFRSVMFKRERTANLRGALKQLDAQNT